MAQIYSQKKLGLADIIFNVGQTVRSLEGGYGQMTDPRNRNVGSEFVKMGYAVFSEVTGRYPNALDGMVDFLVGLAPAPYRPVVKGVIKRLSKEPWDVTVGIVSEIAKEVGKDSETGQYKPTEEVLRAAMGKFLQKEFVEKYLRGS